MITESETRRELASRLGKVARWAGGIYLFTIVLGFLGESLKGPLGISATVAGSLGYVAVTVLLYELFKIASWEVSLIAAIFSLLGCVAFALFAMHRYPLPFNPMVFFGVYCSMIAYLIIRSGLLPKTVGVLMALTGIGWLSFGIPWVVSHLASIIMVVGLAGEGSLTLWLLFRGVRKSEMLAKETFE